MRIAESDWKTFKRVRSLALERFSKRVLDDCLRIIHHGRLIRIFPVDLHSNARDKRATGYPEDDGMKPLTPKSSSQIAYERDFAPVVDPDGGFTGQTH